MGHFGLAVLFFALSFSILFFMKKRMAKLQANLSEYIRKRGWDSRA